MDPHNIDEKEMIGSLLNDSDDQKMTQSKTPSHQPYPIQVPPTYPQQFKYKVYSPQIDNKKKLYKYWANLSNYYDQSIQLKQVPMYQSTPNSGLKAKSYDQLNQFLPEPMQEFNLDADLITKCKDQIGARNIQKEFKEGNQKTKELIFNKLEKGLVPLSMDVFGNYVVQNLLEFGSAQQQAKLIQVLKPQTQQLAYHNYGCRVLQTLLSTAHKYEKQEFQNIFEILKPQVSDLVIDQHGNHVVQNIIQLCGSSISQWVIEGVEGKVSKLTTNSFGCRIIQKAIQISQPEQLKKIYEEIMADVTNLCSSQFGNYIIQQLIKDQHYEVLFQIQQIILNKFEELSLNKFGSNVVDCAIENSNQEFKRKVMDLLVQQKNQQVLFVKLSHNAYGNYVVQNYLKFVDNQLQKELYLKITNNPLLLHDIQQSQFGIYVYQSLVQKQDFENFSL